MKLLINEEIDSQYIEELRSLSTDFSVVFIPNDRDNRDPFLTEITDADALYGWIDAESLQVAKSLKWIQAPLAGLENYCFRELIDSPITVSNMRGIYSDHLADHAFGFLLALARDLPKLMQHQTACCWAPHDSLQMLHLGDLTLGIIGLGGIGYEVARRGAVCGMKILAIDPRRTDKPEEVDQLWPTSELDTLLAESDFVVICAPQTPETTGMIGPAQLEIMKSSAYLINVGRGVIVQLEALVDALNNQRIAGAALDVYETEPLPENHPLWKCPNVILTPHIAGVDPHTLARRFKLLKSNVQRFLNGEQPDNIVDKTQWF